MLNFLSTLWNAIFFQPIFNALVIIYNLIPWHDFGLSIIILTVLIKLLLFPLSKKQIESQKSLQDLQPKIKEIQEKYKHDKTQQSRALMDFYQKNKVNPFSSCFPLIIQLLILYAMYYAFRSGIAANNLDKLYSFVTNPETINNISFGFLDISVRSIPLAILAGILQFIQGKMLQPKKPSPESIQSDVKKNEEADLGKSFQSALGTQMVYFFPLITVFIGLTFPAALTLYWVVSTLFQIVQQKLIIKKDQKVSKNQVSS
jgi:YidC/Oxa1 family membrane protein insertase